MNAHLLVPPLPDILRQRPGTVNAPARGYHHSREPWVRVGDIVRHEETLRHIPIRVCRPTRKGESFWHAVASVRGRAQKVVAPEARERWHRHEILIRLKEVLRKLPAKPAGSAQLHD